MIKQASQDLKSTAAEQNYLLTIIKGIIVSYIITVPAFIVFSGILAYTSFPVKFVTPAVVITTIMSILVAGSFSAKGIKSKGWLNGGVVGLFYMLVLYITSSIIYKNYAMNRYTFTMFVVGVLTGAVGGIVGINLKRGQHQKHKSRGR